MVRFPANVSAPTAGERKISGEVDLQSNARSLPQKGIDGTAENHDYTNADVPNYHRIYHPAAWPLKGEKFAFYSLNFAGYTDHLFYRRNLFYRIHKKNIYRTVQTIE